MFLPERETGPPLPQNKQRFDLAVSPEIDFAMLSPIAI
jgi:hypothetical protein